MRPPPCLNCMCKARARWGVHDYWHCPLLTLLTHRLHLHYCTNGEDRSGRPPHPTCKLQPIVWATTFQGSNDYGNCRKVDEPLGAFQAPMRQGAGGPGPAAQASSDALRRKGGPHTQGSQQRPSSHVKFLWVSQYNTAGASARRGAPCGVRRRDRGGGVILAALVMLLRTG